MTDYASRPELDDELLSAYLDGELPAVEQAAVEARLAADPAAAEMLHQLRAVSQAVQSLPQEVVGRDLGEAILRRVEESRGMAGGAAPVVATAADSHAGSPNDATAQAIPSIPAFTIGRTRRGWVWASLAVAAALLIMVFQSAPNREQKLPAVAQRDEAPVDFNRRKQVADGPLELRALDEESAVPVVVELAQRDAAMQATSELDAFIEQDVRENAPAEPSVPPAQDLAAADRARRFGSMPALEPSAPQAARPTSVATPTIEPLADMDATPPSAPAGAAPAAGEKGVSRAAPADGLAAASPAGALYEEPPAAAVAEREAARGPAAPIGDNQLLVVHVLAKRSALENKTFDQLLATNGIQVAANEAKDAESETVAMSLSRQRAKESETRRALELTTQISDNAMSEEEVMLVEAPQTAILSCLESLSQDQENYLAIDVDETANRELRREAAAASSDFATANTLAAPKKLTEELGLTKYNRGLVPRKEELSSRDKAFYYRYYDVQAQDDRYAGARVGGGYGGGRTPAQQAQDALQDHTLQGKASLGRAVRLRSWGIEGPQLETQQVDEKLMRGAVVPADPQAAATADELGEVQSELKSASAPRADTLHVLFVLQPSAETAPSRPAENTAK